MHGSIPRGCLHSAYIFWAVRRAAHGRARARPTSQATMRAWRRRILREASGEGAERAGSRIWLAAAFRGKNSLASTSLSVLIGQEAGARQPSWMSLGAVVRATQNCARSGMAVETSVSPHRRRYRLGAKSWPWSVQLCHPGGHSGRNRSSQTPLAVGSARPTRWWVSIASGIAHAAAGCVVEPLLATSRPFWPALNQERESLAVRPTRRSSAIRARGERQHLDLRLDHAGGGEHHGVNAARPAGPGFGGRSDRRAAPVGDDPAIHHR